MSVGGRSWGAPRSVGGSVAAGEQAQMEAEEIADGEEQVDQVVADLKEREEEIVSVEKELATGKPADIASDNVKTETAGTGGQAEEAIAKTVVPDDADADGDADAEGEEDDGEDAVGEVDMEDVYSDAQAGPQDMGKADPLVVNCVQG